MSGPGNDKPEGNTGEGSAAADADKKRSDKERQEKRLFKVSMAEALAWPLAFIAAIGLILYTINPWVTDYLKIEQSKAKSTQDDSGVCTLSCGKRCGCGDATPVTVCPTCLPSCLPACPPKTGGGKRKCPATSPAAAGAVAIPTTTDAPSTP